MSNETPIENDGMTAATAPGQGATQAEATAQESAATGTGEAGVGDAPVGLTADDDDDEIDESDAGLPLGNAPLAGGEE